MCFSQVKYVEQASAKEGNSPKKEIFISGRDKPRMTEQLKILKRQHQRTYWKEGKSNKYLSIKKNFNLKRKGEIKKYKEKVINELNDGKRNSSYKALRKLGDHEENENPEFTLPTHLEENLSPQQSAERIAKYFVSISQEFKPIDESDFPPKVKKN